MTLPNFLIIGAPRCGTTSMYHYLKAHPQIFMSAVKEPRFFIYSRTSRTLPDNKSVSTLDDYERLFDEVDDEVAIGEATPTYIGRPDVADKIKELIPDCKLIAILRNPSERAISHYQLFVAQAKDTRSLEDVIAHERQLMPINELDFQTYLSFGLYFTHLTRFLERFPAHQLHIELFDDVIQDTPAALARIYTFLDVTSSFLPDTLNIYNAYQIPRSSRLRDWLAQDSFVKRVYQRIVPTRVRQKATNSLHQMNSKDKATVISPNLHHDLRDFFREDTLRLQDLIQRDLSHWL